MEVAIAGGHGKIGLMLGRLLAGRGDTVIGLIRDPAQEDDLHAAGVEPVVCDLEGDCDVVAAIRGADAIVFAAGAGPGSGPERKWTLD
jgi:nucleoside-diphosphate-sugar epimerase